ncbi:MULTISPECIES: GTA-gp10 family protein [Rhodopseudomonas]|uniref:Gene transfer agent family protein n=1 Tax=Rhodopseudomonas palustris TaxID=1076 RepID=A0A0D7EQZ7_RHOPL|nr:MULTISPECIES: GTA-gp10 family protein [Rhodopseudomonas]KIZ43106.1 hypothetical protein OO17_11920 [Rhodopseudomonas palustris]MDF3810691.1 GTA-gp10 family protein [Rhodopseudomonas sp. BAL398]WOK18481.1 GTA-gp10 family protein [Rhodopseudomonas sp. BAL398]
MSDTSKCAREVTWASGTHIFDLSHPWVRSVLSIRGLPGPNGASPAACLARFHGGTYSIDDCERVIELGLIGGGATRAAAATLLKEHVQGQPLALNAMIAIDILAALFVGAQNVDSVA